MKTIDAIIIHCSATRAGQDLRAKDIDRMHRARGFNQIGYNFIVDLDGIVENGRPLGIDGAHCNTKDFQSPRIISIVLASVISEAWTHLETCRYTYSSSKDSTTRIGREAL